MNPKEEDEENPIPVEPLPKEPSSDTEEESGERRSAYYDEDDLPPGDRLPEAVLRKLETFVPELVRKTFSVGLGAVMSTEEGIRKLTKDVPLPKELASYVASTAGATKDEVMRVMARELREFLQTVNFSEEIAKMLTLLSFEVKTEIRFIPNDEKFGGVEPDVKAKVRLKKQDSNKAPHKNTNDEAEARRRRLTRKDDKK